MMGKHFDYYKKNLKNDLSAGIVVFLVALPLCLGIALASGAPLFSGLIAGMIGGLVVSWLSGSQLSVSGPAAGLTVIILNAIETLGSFQSFLTAVVLAGIIQLALGFLRAGVIGAFFPASVIKGMLAAIGLILIIKQIPHAVGYDISFEGDESYMRETAQSSFNELLYALHALSPGATVVTVVALLILIVWETPPIQRFSLLRLIPGPLLAVLWGIGYNLAAARTAPVFVVKEKLLVQLPIIDNAAEFLEHLTAPDFSSLANPQIYVIAATLAIVASLETLLSLEAVDKLDPHKRLAPTDRELKAQGVGNILSGLLGGLPVTAVIVRSAANINAGGQTRIACFIHGILLLVSILFFAFFLNLIPLACLAAILLQTGYKLARPALFKEFYRKGGTQLVPFVATIVAILLTDLLIGIMIGMAIGLYFVIRSNYIASITLQTKDDGYRLSLNKDVSFLNKALLRKFLLGINADSHVTIDARKAQFIDHDIFETIEDFLASAPDDNITVELIGFDGKKS